MSVQGCHDSGPIRFTGTPLVAMVGNPNAGKTTLFNTLTGSAQKVANYPGVTVEKVTGVARIGETTVDIIDIPGLYSLDPVSEDERVAAEVMRGQAADVPRPDLLVYVLDVTNLERNLYLFSQVSHLGIPTVVALSMSDVAARQGVTIDSHILEEALGVEVVTVVAHRSKGVAELRAAIERTLRSGSPPKPVPEPRDEAAEIVSLLVERLARSGIDRSAEEVRAAVAGIGGELDVQLEPTPELFEALQSARRAYEAAGQPGDETTSRYAWASQVAAKAVVRRPANKGKGTTDRIDRVLTHRVFGLGIFAMLMYLVFQSIYTFAEPLMAGIEWMFSSLGEAVSPLIENVPWLQSLIVDGLIGGVGTMVSFLPQILILFLWIAILEGTGYLARAAFLMDKLLGWCGLNGRAFIPLLSSYACAIPGIMAARVMPDSRSRLATILVAPLMSCSARLPVYVLMIGAFIEPQFGAGWAGFTLFAMHLLGLAVAIPIAWFFNRRLLRGGRLPFVMELPPYQLPKSRDVALALWSRGKIFVKTAGTIIVVLSMVIWALLYFPRSEARTAELRSQIVAAQPGASEETIDNHLRQKLMEESLLGRMGRFIEPVFIPAGFDWRLSTAVLSAFPAREVVVSSMGIMFNLGGEQDDGSTKLRAALLNATWPDGRPLVTPWTAVSLMVFFALCCQCMATLAVIKRETNSWKWPVFVFAYMTALAYIGAVAVYQFGQWVS